LKICVKCLTLSFSFRALSPNFFLIPIASPRPSLPSFFLSQYSNFTTFLHYPPCLPPPHVMTPERRACFFRTLPLALLLLLFFPLTPSLHGGPLGPRVSPELLLSHPILEFQRHIDSLFFFVSQSHTWLAPPLCSYRSPLKDHPTSRSPSTLRMSLPLKADAVIFSTTLFPSLTLANPFLSWLHLSTFSH